MKPRLRLVRGYWHCGIPGKPLTWTVAETPLDAYWLWLRVQQ
jgi:hypothetical protein